MNSTTNPATDSHSPEILLSSTPNPVEFPDEKPIHQWFEERARQRPDAIAVSLGDEQLTYAQLRASAH